MQDKGGTADFLRTIRDDSGSLAGRDQENDGFLHLAFQEYLTAREIRRRGFQEPQVPRNLAAHFGRSWCQEVSLLLLAPEQVDALRDRLARHPYGEIRQRVAERDAMAAMDVVFNEIDGYELVRMPAGSFKMGSPDYGEGRWERTKRGLFSGLSSPVGLRLT